MSLTLHTLFKSKPGIALAYYLHLLCLCELLKSHNKANFCHFMHCSTLYNACDMSQSGSIYVLYNTHSLLLLRGFLLRSQNYLLLCLLLLHENWEYVTICLSTNMFSNFPGIKIQTFLVKFVGSRHSLKFDSSFWTLNHR